MKARSTEESVAAIFDKLQPLKRDTVEDDLRLAIHQQISVLRTSGRLRDGIGIGGEIEKVTQRILDDLTTLEKLLIPEQWRLALLEATDGYATETEFDMMRTKIAAWSRISHDPRLNNLQHLCVRQARYLVERFSRVPPSKTEGGNVHTIAQLLFEAATGQLCEESGLAYAVKHPRF
jgi:hypothetical protein